MLFYFVPNAFAGKPLSISFNSENFEYRWSKNTTYEFTPKGQIDLSSWNDMITINLYEKLGNPEGLAQAANSVLTNYQAYGAKVLSTNSIKATKGNPAQHFIAVVFPTRQYIEIVFAKFKLHEGVAQSIVFSHRIYGEKAGNKAAEWLRLNGPKTEKLMLGFSSFPSVKDLEKIKVTK